MPPYSNCNMVVVSHEDDRYSVCDIDKLEFEGSWREISKVIDLNILNIQYKSQAFDFIFEIFNTCILGYNEKYPNNINYKGYFQDYYLFCYQSDSKLFSVDFSLIYKPWVEQYNCNFNRIIFSKIIKDMVKKHLKLKYVIPNNNCTP